MADSSEQGPSSTEEEERVYDTVRLDEMEYVEDDATYYYECPCGDMFELTEVCCDAPTHQTPAAASSLGGCRMRRRLSRKGRP
jgi:hypothetical protein